MPDARLAPRPSPRGLAGRDGNTTWRVHGLPCREGAAEGSVWWPHGRTRSRGVGLPPCPRGQAVSAGAGPPGVCALRVPARVRPGVHGTAAVPLGGRLLSTLRSSHFSSPGLGCRRQALCREGSCALGSGATVPMRDVGTGPGAQQPPRADGAEGAAPPTWPCSRPTGPGGVGRAATGEASVRQRWDKAIGRRTCEGKVSAPSTCLSQAPRPPAP